MTKYYARIENGEVIGVINFNPKGRYVKKIEDQFVQCTKGVKQRDLYKEGVFSKRPPIKITPIVEDPSDKAIKNIQKTNPVLMQFFEEVVIPFLKDNKLDIPTDIHNMLYYRSTERKKIKVKKGE